MSLIVEADILCDDSTAHVVRNYLTVRCEHTAPRLSGTAASYLALVP